MKETKFIPSNLLEPARKEEVINERWVIKIDRWTKKVTLRIAETNPKFVGRGVPLLDPKVRFALIYRGCNKTLWEKEIFCFIMVRPAV